MHHITQERQRVLLARPIKQKNNTNTLTDTNIFASLRSSQPLPTLNKMRGRSYDFVGSQQFKQKYIQKQPQILNNQPEQQHETEMGHNVNLTNSQMMNTTINRNTILSKLTKQQTNIVTKQMRQLHRYKQYQNYWDKESKKLHKLTLRKQAAKTLLQNNVKDIYIHPNQDRMDIINNYVVNMWEMSLRNHDKTLQRHIKGNKYKPTQLQEMLQTDRGLKTVERSIPILPMQQLKGVHKRDLSLAGRNKAYSQTYRTGQSTQRLTLSQNQTQNQQQVYKISYTGNVKWMSTQGL